MKRAFLALCLAGLGLFNSGCCSCCQKYDDPMLDQQACSPSGCGCQSCGGGCGSGCKTGWHPFRNLFSCTNGCGARYWGDWFTLQAPCCSTCDKCGNYHGRGSGMAPVGSDPGYSMQGGQIQGGQVQGGQMAPDGYQDGTDTIVEDGAPQYMPPGASGTRPRRAISTQ
jgi:hypothetical protein